MVDKTVQEVVGDTYAHATGQQINNREFGKVPYLSNVLTDAQRVQELLGELSQEERIAINEVVGRNLQHDPERGKPRQHQESFISPELVSAFPGLARNVTALNNFMVKSIHLGSAEQQSATELELAQGYLHWEPFDQFRDSARALRDALDKVYKNTEDPRRLELRQAVARIAANCGNYTENDPRLEVILSGNSKPDVLDGACIKMADALTGQPMSARISADSSIITHAGEGDKFKNAIMEGDMRANLPRIISQVSALSYELAALPEPKKNDIRNLLSAYADQCDGLELLRGVDMNKADLIDLLLHRPMSGVAGLDIVMRGGNRPVVDNVQKARVAHVAEDPRGAVNDLRMPVRALSAVMSSLNGDGTYDKMLAMANEITGKCWRIQKGLGLNESLAQGIQGRAQQLVATEHGQGTSPVR